MDEEKIITPEEGKRIIEAILFAAGHPVTFAKLSEVIGISEKEVRKLVGEYAHEYESAGLPRGIQLLQLGNACQIVTKEVQVEVLPTDDFCNISIHHLWPVLFAASAVMNLVLAAALVFVIKHKNKQVDETPLVNYDIYDDMDDYT